jgi:hypothetical protein
METISEHTQAKHYGPLASWMDPYQCFMARWEGLCKTFNAQGDFIEASAVHMDCYWVNEDKTTWHLHEHFENLYEVGETVYHTDLHVKDKFVHGESDIVRIEGSMLTPYNYVFTIWSGVTNTTVYNNHYFIDPNNRRIITHKIRDGKTHVYQIQDFVRVG